jgi:hypothetical protein
MTRRDFFARLAGLSGLAVFGAPACGVLPQPPKILVYEKFVRQLKDAGVKFGPSPMRHLHGFYAQQKEIMAVIDRGTLQRIAKADFA